jgi:hypothetical protein
MSKTYINGCQDVVFYQGIPLSGCLYFMESGSSSAKVIYSDKERTTQMANPVFLNEYGEPPAVVYFGLGDYKIGHFAYTGNGDMNNDWADQDIRPTVFDLVETEYQEGISVSNALAAGSNIYCVNNIAELCAVVPTEHDRVMVNGYYTRGDAPARLFQWITDSVALTNLGTCFSSTVAGYAGRWIMASEDKGILDCRVFGIIPNISTNIYGYLVSAINWINGTSCKAETMYFPSGAYSISGGTFNFKCKVIYGCNSLTNGVSFVITQSDVNFRFYNDFENECESSFTHENSIADKYVKPVFYKNGQIAKASWCYNPQISALKTMVGNSEVILDIDTASTMEVNVSVAMPVLYILDADVTVNKGVLTIGYTPLDHKSGSFKLGDDGAISISDIMLPASTLSDRTLDKYSYTNNGGILADVACILTNDGTQNSLFAAPLHIVRGGSLASSLVSSAFHCCASEVSIDDGLEAVLGDFITLKDDIKASWYSSIFAAINSHTDGSLDLEGNTFTLTKDSPDSTFASPYAASNWTLKNGTVTASEGSGATVNIISNGATLMTEDLSAPIKTNGTTGIIVADRSTLYLYYGEDAIFGSVQGQSSSIQNDLHAAYSDFENCDIGQNAYSRIIHLSKSIVRGNIYTGSPYIGEDSTITGSIEIDGQYGAEEDYENIWNTYSQAYETIMMYELKGSITHSSFGGINIKAYATGTVVIHRTVVKHLIIAENHYVGTGISSTDDYTAAPYYYGFQLATEKYGSSSIVGTNLTHMHIHGNIGWHKDTEMCLYIGDSSSLTDGSIYTALKDNVFTLTGDDPFFVIYEGNVQAYGPSASMWPTASLEYRDSRYSRETASFQVPYMAFAKIYY